MGDQDAGQAVYARPVAAREPGQHAGEDAGAAVQRENAERGDDCRQCQRHGEQPQHQRSAGKGLLARKGARHENRRRYRQDGGEQGLEKRETGDAEEIGIESLERAAPVAAGLEDEAGERAAGDERDGDERERPGGDPPVGRQRYLLIADSHSSTQALRFLATSSLV